jgi:pilus assembly protein CpaC
MKHSWNIRQTVLHTALMIAVLSACAAAPWRAFGQTDAGGKTTTVPKQHSRSMTLELNKSRLIDLPGDVSEVVISNPAVVEAVVRTPRRVHLLGQQIGQASAVFMGREGARLLTLDISVERDLAPVAAMIHRLIPAARVKLEPLNDNIILTGTVPSPLDATRAADIAGRFAAKRENVLNMLNVEAKEQVLLRVTVAEMNRSVIKRMGVDIQDAFRTGNLAVAKLSQTAFPVTGGLIAGGFVDAATREVMPQAAGTTILGSWQASKNHVDAVVKILERKGLARTLAEPNLTSISGETADFLAGGEYPVPVGGDKEQTTISFKPFGVKLSFTPVVLSEGRISLKVATEVSELTSEGAVVVNTINIPALKVRRASSTLELPSGGSVVMAGLISSETRKSVEGIPGMHDLPVLGALFRSDDFIRAETEMVVIVTPYLVETAPRHALKLPGEDPTPEVFRPEEAGITAFTTTVTPVEKRTDKGFGFIIE